MKRTLTRPIGEVRGFSFSPDGTILAGVTWNPKDYDDDYDYKVFLWDVATGETKRILDTGSRIRRIAFSPDGTVLASLSYDSEVRLWDIETGAFKVELAEHKGEVRSICIQSR